jgi:hypothetical protein
MERLVRYNPAPGYNLANGAGWGASPLLLIKRLERLGTESPGRSYKGCQQTKSKPSGYF